MILLTMFIAQSVRAVGVVPANISPNDLAWLAEATSTQGTLSALLSKPVNGSLMTAQGKALPLPANWSAAIPRATLAASAANVLKRAGGYGLAAYTLYSVLSPVMGLNGDGTVTTTLSPDTYNASYAFNACPAYQGTQSTSGSTAAVCSWMSGKVAAAYSACGYSGPPTVSPDGQGNCKYSTGGVVPLTWQQIGGGTVTSNPTEAELSDKIQSSSVSDKALLDAALADSVAKSYSNDMVRILPANNPVSITASPVTAPQETLSTATVPNADGTTSTVTKKSTVTATPQVSGSTAADAKIEWTTTNVDVTTSTNNSTNVTTTTTTTTNEGTATTQKPTDYGTFSGASPDDAFVTGKAKIQASLCGGNCATALSCSNGTCTPTERINLLKAKYSLATTSSGTCPAFTMDISGQGYGSHTSTAYCDLAESVRSQVATIISLVIAIGFIVIVLGA